MKKDKRIKFEEQKGAIVISFKSASLGISSEIEGIASTLTTYIEVNKPKVFVVDFNEVKFFSSQALGMLLNIWKKIESYSGKMAICGIDPQLSRVFRITNLDKIFKFYPDSESAVNDLI